MIEALLRDCRDVEGVGRLFAELGYPVKLRAIGDDDLERLGVAPGGPAIHHLARYDGVDLYAAAARSDEERARLKELVRVLSERNHVLRSVVVELEEARSTLSIHGWCGRTRRRLDVDTSSPSADAIDRICGLMVRGRERDEVDPGLLFERALDREAIGRRFFERFRRSVTRVADALAAILPDECDADRRDEALLVLSRILFVYLLQRKGWLDGDHRFLRERLERCLRTRSSFHRTVLDPLFFDCLNKPAGRRPDAARRLGRIPYLNGGLFEPSAFARRNPGIELANELWQEILDSTFESFSLSVSEVDEEGAHIDPEMLGKVFEKLMESDERARSGSFYTPRAVVDRLTEAAIVRWLAEGDAGAEAALRGFLRGETSEPCAGREARLLRRLESITVLDPACGSGAFLLSAMRMIETLWKALAAAAGEPVPTDLRARIAASSLYGVDLKMEAVRLCELRIWLAIVSGSDLGVDSVPPLPNLDRNVMQGDSLVGPIDFLGDEKIGTYRDWIRGLRERASLLDAYRRSSSARRRTLATKLRASDLELARGLVTRSLERAEADLSRLREADGVLFEGAPDLSGKEKVRLRALIAERRRLLGRLERGELSFFSYDLHFANVVAAGGFSVVLGNPPWVRGSRVEPGRRKVLADRYRSFSLSGTSGFGQAEVAMAFAERALALTAPGGVLAQLLPSKVTSADYAAAVRHALTAEASVMEIHDWSTEGRSLFSADVFPLGIVASKSRGSDAIRFTSGAESYTIERQELSVSGPGSPWSTTPPDIRRILGRLRERFSPLEETLGRRPLMGVKTGANDRFFLDDVEVENGGVRLPTLGLAVPAAAVVRVVRGRDVKRWSASDSTWMLWPAGLAGDRALASAIAKRLGTDVASLRLSYVRSEHLGLKVAWKDVSRGLCAALLPDRVSIGTATFSVVPNQTLYSIDVASREEGLVIAALLNSIVLDALALETTERAKDHHWRYLAPVVAGLPLPRVTRGTDDWRALVRVARRAETGEAAKQESNEIVARLYGISSRELTTLTTFVAARLGQCHASSD